MNEEQHSFRHGLRVRLIEDPTANRAAALFQIASGSLHEPRDWPGLAHLLEHVLFAGSRAFQNDERLMIWLQAKGGRLNATTRDATTAYFFECPPALLAEGLARLTDMLVAPLIDDDAVRQEVAAIDAEYRLLASHRETLAEAAVSAAFTAHPWQRFRVGDRPHFGDVSAALRSALAELHQRTCRAGNITLWLQGPQPMAELRQMAANAAQCFVPNRPPHIASAHPPTHIAPFQPRVISLKPAAGRETNNPGSGESTLWHRATNHPARRGVPFSINIVQTASALSTIPRLKLASRRNFMLRCSDGERLRFSFLLRAGYAREAALLRLILQDEAEGSLMAALRERGLCDALRVLSTYRSETQEVISIELSLMAAPPLVTDDTAGQRVPRGQAIRRSGAVLQHFGLLNKRYFSSPDAKRSSEGQCDCAQSRDVSAGAYRSVCAEPPVDPLYREVASIEGLLWYRLQQLASLSDAQLNHYAMLGRAQFGHLPVMDQLRERACGFPPPELTLHWRELLLQLTPDRLTRLRSGRLAVTALRRIQGFRLPLVPCRVAEATLPAAMPILDFFPHDLPAVPAAAGTGAVVLPQRSPHPERAILLLSPAENLSSVEGNILQAAVRPLAANCRHGGGDLHLTFHQGLWLLQLSGARSAAGSTLAALAERLTRLPAFIRLQGEHDHQRQQRTRYNDIAIRALLDALPSLWLPSAASDKPRWHRLCWQASLYGGDATLRHQLAVQLASFPGQINPPGAARRPQMFPRPEYCVETASEEAAVALFCPLPEMTAHAAACWQCLALIYQPAFFQQLRVEKNVGYVVSCRSYTLAGHPGILFCLQSPTLGCAELCRAIDDFLQAITVTLTAQRLEESRQVLLAALRQQERDPAAASRAAWLQQQSPAPPASADVIERLQPDDIQYYHTLLQAQRQFWLRVSNRRT